MGTRLIIEGNSVYEIDEECLACSANPSPERKGQKEYRETSDSYDRIKTFQGKSFPDGYKLPDPDHL